MAVNFWRIAASSSEMHDVSEISQPRPRQNATTAGPEASSRSPLATESLMVRMATRIVKVVSSSRIHNLQPEVLLRFNLIPARLVHQAHRFHQQPGGVLRRAGPRG